MKIELYNSQIVEAIALDQHEYVASLRTMARPELSSKQVEDSVGVELHSFCRSLLEAVACLLLRRKDVAVFVSALQRWGHARKKTQQKSPRKK